MDAVVGNPQRVARASTSLYSQMDSMAATMRAPASMIGQRPSEDLGPRPSETVQPQETGRGLPVTQSRSLKAVGRVLLAVGALSSFYTLWFIGELLLTTKWDNQGVNSQSGIWRGVTSLLFELAVPCCGYFGAMYSNRQLTCCFCSCSLLVSVLTFLFLVIKMISDFGKNDLLEEAAKNNKEVSAAFLDFLAFLAGKNLYSVMPADHMPSAFVAPLVGEVVSVAPEANADVAVATRQ